MWSFRRKNDIPVTSEVKEYYQSGQQERVGVAWLLALTTLVTTIILAIGLFWGGRWAYRKFAKKDNKPTTVQTEQVDTDNHGTQTPDADAPQTGTPQTSSTQTSEPSPAAPSTPASTPQTAGQRTLPNTGPDIDL